MDQILNRINTEVFEKCGLTLSQLNQEQESREYAASKFELNSLRIVNRNAKTTPKKIGQFVTFWKRNNDGLIEPYEATDSFDFFVVNVEAQRKLGQFVFPKSMLIKKGILSSDQQEGKRAFRVYPEWDSPTNKQAKRTQKWQSEFFYEISDETDLTNVIHLYENT